MAGFGLHAASRGGSPPLTLSPAAGHVRRAACDRNGLGNAFQAARPSCGAAACIAHDGEPGESDREHDAVAIVLIIGASRGIGLETVKAALEGDIRCVR